MLAQLSYVGAGLALPVLSVCQKKGAASGAPTICATGGVAYATNEKAVCACAS